jgi:hypothetical protein
MLAARVAAASIVEAAPLALAGLAALALVVGAVVIFVRRRRPALELRKLDAAEAGRYVETFAGAERDFEARPEVAIAQARGIVEEVLRRMGLPDRVDGAQKARDLAAHDRGAAAALETADRALREDADRESLRRALTSYREVLDQLLDDATGR